MSEILTREEFDLALRVSCNCLLTKPCNACRRLLAHDAAQREEIERLTKALHEAYTWTGEEAGDEDDFRALVNKSEAVPEAVKRLRGQSDNERKDHARLRARLERAEGLLRILAFDEHGVPWKSPTEEVVRAFLAGEKETR